MKKLIQALIGTAVEISFASRPDICRGRVQSVRGDIATIDDYYGGAYGVAISQVKGLRVDDGQPALILVGIGG